MADYLLTRLVEEDIDTVFGLTGGGIMHLIDAFSFSKEIRFQPVHHEEFAGTCADGYARSGKKFGVAFATTGPGAAHLFTAAAAAWQDSVPVILVVGQVKTADSSRVQGLTIRQNGTFEFDTVQSFSSITKKASIADSTMKAIESINEAIFLCQSGRPGPVLIEIPLDVQASKIPDTKFKFPLKSIPKRRVRDSDVEKEFLEVTKKELINSSRPVLLLGAGVVRSNAEPHLRKLLSNSKIPYVVTQFAKGLGSLEDELFLGSPGIKPNRSANMILAEADLILAIGTSLHQQVIGWSAEKFKNLKSRKIWTEIDSDVLQSRSHLVDKTFELDSATAIEITLRCLEEKVDFRETSQDWIRRARFLRQEYLLHYPKHESEKNRFSLYEAVSIFSARANRFKSVITDSGQAWYVVAQHYFPARNSFYISSGSFGSMGMALPLAIGSASATNLPTLCFTGDGSLMTSLQELATLASSQLPILLAINSNDGYASIRATHDKFFDGRKIGTDSSNGLVIPRIDKIAELFDIKYASASNESELESILESEECRNLEAPLIIELKTFKNQKVEPMIVSIFDNKSGLMDSGSITDLYPDIGNQVRQYV